MTRTLLSEAEGYMLLKTAGIPVPVFSVARSPQDAARIADSIGYPVVMKVISREIVHKSDAGGVITGIRSADEARTGFRPDLALQSWRINRARRLTGSWSSSSSCRDWRLIVGGKTDPTFGKVITIGSGGKTGGAAPRCLSPGSSGR